MGKAEEYANKIKSPYLEFYTIIKEINKLDVDYYLSDIDTIKDIVKFLLTVSSSLTIALLSLNLLNISLIFSLSITIILSIILIYTLRKRRKISLIYHKKLKENLFLILKPSLDELNEYSKEITKLLDDVHSIVKKALNNSSLKKDEKEFLLELDSKLSSRNNTIQR